MTNLDSRPTEPGRAGTRATPAALRRLAALGRSVRDIRRRGVRVTPATVFNTIRLSVRATGRPWYELPVIVSGPTLVRVSRRATIDIAADSRLLIGSGGTQHVFDADRSRAAFVVLRNGHVAVRGGRARLSWGTKVCVSPDARLDLGGGTFVNANCIVLASTSITFGERCFVAWGTTVMDTDFHAIDASRPRAAPVSIGHDTWIASEVLVLKGTTIGPGSVIGARSIVKGEIPDRSVAVGQPARVVRSDVDWEL